MKSRIELGDVPVVGAVAAEIRYQVLANGEETNHTLGDARYADGRGRVEDEHRPAVGQHFNAFA